MQAVKSILITLDMTHGALLDRLSALARDYLMPKSRRRALFKHNLDTTLCMAINLILSTIHTSMLQLKHTKDTWQRSRPSERSKCHLPIYLSMACLVLTMVPQMFNNGPPAD